MTYRRADEPGGKAWERPLIDTHVVLCWENDAVIFACPCGGREVYVTSPPHTITFSEDGKLTLDGSVGSKEGWKMVRGVGIDDLPKNWCHFWLKDGEPEMCDDAKCPGGQGSD